jgi:hypothetical protein
LGQPGEKGPLAATARGNEGIESVKDDQAPASHPLTLLRRLSLILGNAKRKKNNMLKI